MIRDAHAAAKDLRAAVGEAEQEVRALATGEVAAAIRTEVSRQLDELGQRTREAGTAATQKVISEFGRSGESLPGKQACRHKASGRRPPRHRRGAARHLARGRQPVTHRGGERSRRPPERT